MLVSSLYMFCGNAVIAQDDSGMIDLLTAADNYISHNQFELALEKTQEVLTKYPGSIPAIQKQINIYYLMNDDKEALRVVELAIRDHPEEPELYYLRGIINNTREKYSRAINDFDQALALPGGNDQYKIFLGRGISHMNLVEYEQAMSDLSRSIYLNDTIASSYHSRALLNYELKDYSAAINDFIKALDYSDVGNAVLYFNLGMSYFRLEDNLNACPYFHKSCTLGNNNACRMVLMECAKEIPEIP